MQLSADATLAPAESPRLGRTPQITESDPESRSSGWPRWPWPAWCLVPSGHGHHPLTGRDASHPARRRGGRKNGAPGCQRGQGRSSGPRTAQSGDRLPYGCWAHSPI